MPIAKYILGVAIHKIEYSNYRGHNYIGIALFRGCSTVVSAQLRTLYNQHSILSY